MTHSTTWPALDMGTWTPTKKSFHLYVQMLGKLRVALSPTQPNWLFTALALSSRGLTTGPVPWRGTSIQASLDVFSSELIVERSNGETRRVALLPVRTVAEIYAELQYALSALDVECTISPIPQELPDATPLHEDHRPAAYEPHVVQRWFYAATAAASFFDGWRAHFFGRTGIQVWWGALDVSLMLFNGKHAAPPTDRGYIMKYDLDAELMNVGLFFGDEQTAPFFYGYIFPQPPGAAKLPIAPPTASWSDTLKEWVLPYEAVRAAADSTAELRAFLDAIYMLCTTAAGWDRDALSYAAPKRPLPWLELHG
ncbi:MAG: hypothetical protein GIW98_05455 [Candidatus Eremiobacteraeota bacterium]|nr:hypothetical protein [Candidatus Eremiobacteraeota bacterium]